jgi:soluble lytic murein transglycosylase-like protein
MTPLEPLSPPQQVSGPLTPAAQEVKTPTVLEVKRVEVPASVNISNAPQLSKQEIQTRLVSAALGAGLDPALTQAVVKAESSFNVRAVSNDGHASKGLFQLLDSTGKHLMSRADGVSKKYDPFNPDLNIKLGTNYLRYLHDIFKVPTELPNNLKTVAAADSASLERFAVAAFNAGEGRVASAQSRSEVLGKDPAYYDQVAPLLPRSTREYVKRVIEGKDNFLLAPKS